MSGKLTYRPEIDGLRAVAVGVVVLYHAGLGFPGGYIGVDVFFVISGFLITQIILQDLESGSFTMMRFWERRIRRIMPALLAMMLLVLLAGWFLLLPPAYHELGRSSLWQLIFLSNVFFWRHTGYFDGLADEKPLLHTWSLSVEEQFYLCVPLFLAALWKYGRCPRQGITLAVGGLTVASFFVSLSWMQSDKGAAFYLLPSRAWELGMGALLGTLPASFFPKSRASAEVAAWIGILMVIYASQTFDAETAFPGANALWPCIGTTAVIWAGCNRQRNSVALVLSMKPLVWVGLLSYSLYLWHWPLFAFYNYWDLRPADAPPALLERWALVGATLILAYFSYRFVEQPFRRREFCATRCALFVTSALASAACLVFALGIYLSQGIPIRVSRAAQVFSSAVLEAAAPGLARTTSQEDVSKGHLIKLGTPGAEPSVLVWGDSHATCLLPAFDMALAERGLGGLAATSPGTAPLLDFYRVSKSGLNEKAVQYSNAVVERVQRDKIPHVFLVARWSGYIPRAASGRDGYGDADNQLRATLEALSKAGAKTWVVLEVPAHHVAVPKALAYAEMFGGNDAKFWAKPAEKNIFQEEPFNIELIQSMGGRVIDLRPLFLNGDSGRYVVQLNGRSLYRDEHHLVPYAAETLVAPYLSELFGDESLFLIAPEQLSHQR